MFVLLKEQIIPEQFLAESALNDWSVTVLNVSEGLLGPDQEELPFIDDTHIYF